MKIRTGQHKTGQEERSRAVVLSCPFSQYRGARAQARPVSIPRVPSPASSSSSSSSSSSPSSASAETHQGDAVDSVARRAQSSSSPSAESEPHVTKAVCASGKGKADELSDVSSCSPSNSDVEESYCAEAERGKVETLTFLDTLINNIVDKIRRRHLLALLSLRHYYTLSSKQSQHKVSSKVLEAPFN